MSAIRRFDDKICKDANLLRLQYKRLRTLATTVVLLSCITAAHYDVSICLRLQYDNQASLPLATQVTLCMLHTWVFDRLCFPTTSYPALSACLCSVDFLPVITASLTFGLSSILSLITIKLTSQLLMLLYCCRFFSFLLFSVYVVFLSTRMVSAADTAHRNSSHSS